MIAGASNFFRKRAQASLYNFIIVYSNRLPVVLQRLYVITVTLLVSKAEGL
jgi:hypothetical protein